MSERLRQDHLRLCTLVDGSPGLVAIHRSVGQPPSQYELVLACRSVTSSSEGQLSYRDTHTVEILLGPDYPYDEPSIRMLTPVFHPHVFANDRVCLGDWTGAEFLDLLVKRLFRILQFDPAYLDGNSVANWAAQQWVEANRGLFPLGTVVPGQPSAQKPRITFTPR
jgi:Ubiquitin-conjugating enzyme